MTLKDKVIDIFKEINQIPRGSGNELNISNWLIKLGKNNNWETFQDDVLNVILKVPGKGDLAHKETVIIQGHMDMVCVKEVGSNHDFTKDPIQMYIEDGWLKAKGTTLGADNAVALAIGLAIALEKNISHPPLELLFTIDEERGLTGAKALKPDMLKGKYLINIDSGDFDDFTIGCAGGRDVIFSLPLVYEDITYPKMYFELSIDKLRGGHSGIQINEQKPNAIHLITRILKKIIDKTNNFNICYFDAGVAHNAIPTNATVRFSTDDAGLINEICSDMFKIIRNEYRETEPEMTLSINKLDTCDCPSFTYELSRQLISLIMALPHGVFNMSKSEGLVETSNNLAILSITDNVLNMLLSIRSAIASKSDFLTEKIKAIATLGDFDLNVCNGYPAWEPNYNSDLIKKSVLAYKKLFDKEPKIKIIHAGLECGIIGDKYPGMEMLAIGPEILDAHTPQERLKIDDIDKIVLFLLELFQNL